MINKEDKTEINENRLESNGKKSTKKDRFDSIIAALIKTIRMPTIVIFLLVNISIVGLIYVFINNYTQTIIAYVLYPISAYALTLVCVRIPGIVSKCRQKIYTNKYTERLITDKELRIRISLYGGMLINSCFAILKVVIGILYDSAWLFAMAGYNMILSIMRFVLIYRDQKERKLYIDELTKRRNAIHSYKVCGIMMLILNIAISVIVFMVLVQDQEIRYPGLMIFAIAAYTFYCLTMSIINIIKYWKTVNPIFSAVKRLIFAKTLVSIFTMEVAMITQFGDSHEIGMEIMQTITGIVISGIILTIAILMILDANKERIIN